MTRILILTAVLLLGACSAKVADPTWPATILREGADRGSHGG